MSAIDEFGEGLNSLVADIEAQFKSLNDLKKQIKEQSTTVVTGWSDYFAKQRADLQRAQDALNRISNAPVSGTAVKPSTGGALSTVMKKVTNG